MATRRKPPTEARQPARPEAPNARALRKLWWTDRALADLEEIGEFIARDKPRAAERWVQALMAVAERAALAPMSGRRVPEFGRVDIRELRKRTYRVVYRVAEARVAILTIFEGHRLFPRDVDVPEPDP